MIPVTCSIMCVEKVKNSFVDYIHVFLITIAPCVLCSRMYALIVCSYIILKWSICSVPSCKCHPKTSGDCPFLNIKI